MPRWPPAGEFSSLFRLLDEYTDHLTRRIGPDGGIVSGARSRAFAPRFDVRETEDAYVLDGELPGIDQKDINIEFTDPHTLVISGRTERSFEKGTPPEESGSEAGAQAGGETETKAVEKVSDDHRYWVSERSIGEFSRTFTFPAPVDQENVKASLKNGVLSITVPKTAAPTGKRITIESA
jgi:HSP20 family molecular chaperone IbpA